MNRVFDNYLFEAFANASDNIFVYVTDIGKDITRWSRQAVEYFGLEGEYLHNVKDMWLSFVHPADRKVYLDDITAVFTGKSSHHNCEYRVRNRYGEFVWVECRGSIIYDDSGKPRVFAGIMTRIDNTNKYDELTHLLSGSEFFRQPLTHSGTLMMIGVDKLRIINSQHGMLYGNSIICHLARVLEKELAGSVIYRFCGDDFLIVGRGISTDEMVSAFERISDGCKKAEISSHLVSFSVSAGIVRYEHDENLSELISRTELTITYAKEQPSHYAVYNSELAKAQCRKQLISEELIRSIQHDFRGFSIVYQPIMSNDTRKAVACEALLRWDSGNEQIGRCNPDEFIPILEKNGGIIEVGSFVMREAIKRVASWQEMYPGLKVSINASYFQMQAPGFADEIIAEIRRNNLDPSLVIIELTESVLIDDTFIVRNTFESLKRYGINAALDDFGRGNSSFWMLHNLNVDYVKLDQAFIRSLRCQCDGIDFAIVKSTLMLCKSIGCSAIAEGIETEAVYSRIRDLGFSGLQGFMFSAPLEPAAFEGYLNGLKEA